jgi:hypothetical protein
MKPPDPLGKTSLDELGQVLQTALLKNLNQNRPRRNDAPV